MTSFLFLLYLISVFSIKLTILKTGLLYLPCEIQLLKFHHVVLLEKDKDKIVVDLIPEKINIHNLFKLLIGKDIQAKIRIRSLPENISDKNLYSFICSPIGQSITNQEVNSLSLKLFLNKIKNWNELKKNNYTMNIYKRNCQHYRYFIQQQNKLGFF